MEMSGLLLWCSLRRECWTLFVLLIIKRQIPSYSAAFYDCTWEHCESSDKGGAIYMTSDTEGTITILRCAFDNVSASSYGGAFHIDSITSATVGSCIFQNTSATYYGAGWLYTISSCARVHNCSFYTCAAQTYDTGGILLYILNVSGCSSHWTYNTLFWCRFSSCTSDAY
jgi:hypothetical protein